MDARDKSRVAAIVRAALFAPSHAADWTPVPPAPATPAQANTIALFEKLNKPETGILARFTKLGIDVKLGTSNFRSGATAKGVQRNGLKSELKALNEGADTVSEVLKKPEIMDGFRMPHGDDENLKTTALAFAKNAKQIETELIALGFEEDFIEDLQERVRLFAEADDAKEKGLQGQVGAGDGLEDVIEDGLLILKQLNTLLKNLYKSDSIKRGEWLTASHIERVWTSGKKKPKTDGDNPTTPSI